MKALPIPLLQLLRLIHLIQSLLQQSHIFGIAFQICVCQVTDKRDQTDEEIQRDVEEHGPENCCSETAGDFAHGFDVEACHAEIEGIAGGGDYTEDGGPAEADAHEVEEAEVELVGSAAGTSEDFGIVFGDVRWDLFFDFLGFTRFAGMGNLFVVGVLYEAC